MKWLTADEAQSEYARNLECKLGVAARNQTANINVLADIDWTKEEYLLLNEQRQYTKGIPEIPGSYYVARNINNALRNVVSYNNDPQEVLKEYTIIINDEITNKREQYNLNK